MSRPSTAVIVPVGRRSDVFEQQLRNVVAQGGNEVQVVLSVNDSDPVFIRWFERVVDSVGPALISTIDSSSVRSAAHARNAGVASTSAEQLVFCDADDLIDEGWLSALLLGLSNFDAVSGHMIDLFPDERMAGSRPPTTPGRLPALHGRPYLLSGNLAIKRQAFTAIGGFDESLHRCEDIALGWALQNAGYTIGYVPDAKVRYNQRAGLVAMVKQHYHYGRGMSQVLRRYGRSTAAGYEPTHPRSDLLRPNSRILADPTPSGVARRGAIAVGRVRGLIG